MTESDRDNSYICIRKIGIRMDADRKDYLLYPAITAALISGLNAFSDWRRGTLESIWWYVIAALILYAILAISRYLVYRKRNK